WPVPARRWLAASALREPACGAAFAVEPVAQRARSSRLPPPSVLDLTDLERGAEVRRARTRVALELLGPGRDGALGDQLGLGLAATDADGQLRRADAAAGPVGEEALDAPVLERVEGDRAQPAADGEDAPAHGEGAVERVELPV